MQKRKSSVNLEKSLHELEKIVTQLEQGDLSLEEAMKHFEQGISLTRTCQQALTEAEQKVEILLGDKPVPFKPEEDKGNQGNGPE